MSALENRSHYTRLKAQLFSTPSASEGSTAQRTGSRGTKQLIIGPLAGARGTKQLSLDRTRYCSQFCNVVKGKFNHDH